MSDDNKTILNQANAAIARGDHEGFLSHCTDDTRWTFMGERELIGKQAVREYLRDTYLEPPKFHVERLIADGEWLTAIGEIDLKDNAGKTTHYAYCDIWRIRDGKLAELRAYVVETST
jgi:ketosteroid isomerase-like protein